MKKITGDRIIVTGQMRSGTTMLCSFLDGQKNITMIQDVLLVAVAAIIRLKPPVKADHPLSPEQKKLVLDEVVRLTFMSGKRPKDARNIEWDMFSKMKETGDFPEFNDLADLYLQLLDRLADEAKIEDGTLFGTKSTRSEDLARVCAGRGIKAIMILRDPRATFVSHFRRAQSDPAYRVKTDVSHFITSWRDAFNIWKAPGKYLSIRYEDFVADPTLGGKMASYLNRDIDPNAVIKTANSSFGDKVTGTIRPAAVDRWREHADPTHIKQIEKSLRKEMAAVGYM